MARREIFRSLVRHLENFPCLLPNEAAPLAPHSSANLVEGMIRGGRPLEFNGGTKAPTSSGQYVSASSSNLDVLSKRAPAMAVLGFVGRPTCMSYSTVSNGKEHISAEELHIDTVEGGVEPDVRASVLEFVPPTESAPCTPLVNAIESQNATLLQDTQFSPTDSSRSDFTGLNLRAPDSRSRLSEEDAQKITPSRVYIGGLPFDIRGQDLSRGVFELCEQYGSVKEVSLSRYRDQTARSIEAGKHRGFVFVTMETPEEAQALIDNLNGRVVWGRAIMVSHGLVPRSDQPKKPKMVSRSKIFIGNLHENTSSEDLERHFEEHGPIENIKLITDFATKQSRGFAFITFAEEKHAMRAVLDKDGSILEGSALNVNIAKYPQAD